MEIYDTYEGRVDNNMYGKLLKNGVWEEMDKGQ
jgi:hypothetical protein